MRHLLTSQARGTPAPSVGQPHVLGLQVRAALAQKVGQLGPAPLPAGGQQRVAMTLTIDAVELDVDSRGSLNLDGWNI